MIAWLTMGSVNFRRQRYIVTALYIPAAVAVSVMWHAPALHRFVVDCCAYRGRDLFDAPTLKLLGGTLLIPRPWELLTGMMLIALAVPVLEALIGPAWTLFSAVIGNAVATVVVDVTAHSMHRAGALDAIDSGSSVVLVVAAVIISGVTRSKRLGLIIAVTLLGDLTLNHDLASAEHLAAVVVGAALAFAFGRRSTRSTGERGNLAADT